MKFLRTALVLALWIAVATVPVRPEPPALTLRCSFDKSLLRFSGTAPGTTIEYRISFLTEQLVRGRLEEKSLDVGHGAVEVKDGSFAFEAPQTARGVYRVAVGARSFDFFVWDDEFVSLLLDKQERIDSLAAQVEKIHQRIEVATATQFRWHRAGHEILFDALNLQDRARGLAAPHSHFPAAELELQKAVLKMTSVTPHFFWDAQGFGGAFDQGAGAWVLGADGRPFGFGRASAHLRSVRDLLRRENSLWLVRNARRAFQDARPRLPAVEANLDAMEATLDRMEAAIRGKRREEPVVAPPPTPRQFVELVARNARIREAQDLLEQADRLWDQVDDRRSPSLYRQLQSDYRDVLDDLKARVRVGNRSRAESE